MFKCKLPLAAIGLTAAALLAATGGCSRADAETLPDGGDAPAAQAAEAKAPATDATESTAGDNNTSHRPAAAKGRPNIVLVVYDNTRFDRYSINGNTRKTSPFFDRLAQEGLYIAKGIAPATWTFPSHASMFTGFANHQLGVDFLQPNHLVIDPNVRTIAELLFDHGYYTVSYPDHPYFGPVSASLTRGFERFDILFNPLETPSLAFSNTPTGALMDRRLRVPAPTEADKKSVVKAFRGELGEGKAAYHRPPADKEVFPPVRPYVEKYVEERYSDLLATLKDRGDEPFFLFLNLHNGPKHVTTLDENNRWLTAYLAANDLGPVPLFSFNDIDNGFLKSDYIVAFCDATLEILYEKITQTPGMENTVFIVASDHGQAHGEHGEKEFYKHGNAWPWEYMVHVPALIHFPASAADRPQGRIDQWVSLRELFFTIADIAGCADDAYVERVAGGKGRSLIERFQNNDYPTYVTTESHVVVPYSEIADVAPELRKRQQIGPNQELAGRVYAIYAGQYKYIITPGLELVGRGGRAPVGTAMLFDTENDKGERMNVLDTHRDVVAKMLSYYRTHLHEEESTDFKSLPALPFDDETLRQLRSLGYAE